MSTKRHTIIAIALVSIVVVLLWWANAPRTEEPRISGLPITVARYFWPGQYWIEIAHRKGWFEAAGLNVVLVDTNPDYYGSLKDTLDGKIDINNFTLFDVMNANAGGAELVMIINADISFGAEAIVAGRKIRGISDLRGGTVGVGVETYTEYILDVVLERNGVKPGEVKKVDLGAELAAKEFAGGKLDAVVTWEPVVTEIIESGRGKKLFDTSEIPGLSPNGQVVRRSLMEERPADLQAYVEVWHRTTRFIRENPEEAFGIIAEIYDTPPGEVQAFARLDKILDLRDNQAAFTYAPGFQSLFGSARWINKFLIRHGIMEGQLDSTEFIDGRFIRRLRPAMEGI